ncbi:MAG: aminopeptidase P family protein [Chloroflexi bacterium]|nr:aminopeptidase P family protein [Chloroflexota bacterium]
MTDQRVDRLREQMEWRGLDVVALVPGPNLFYLTGCSFHLSERPIVALFTVEGRAAIVLPALEVGQVGSASVEMETFPYRDEDGHDDAFRDACDALSVSGTVIGVEMLQMRGLELRVLEQNAPGSQTTAAEDVLFDLRVRKDASEIALMRRAVTVTEAALEVAVGQIRAGMTEREIAALLSIEMLRAGAEGLAFAPIVVAGPNAAMPHAVPSDRAVDPGDTIVIDCGASAGGYAGDITRTFSVGLLSAEWIEIYEIVQAANAAGRAAAQPGVSAEEIDRAARSVIEAAGYGAHFIHRTGHGLGLEAHEPPYIVSGNSRALEPGMVFTVEPGIYLPGRGGVRIEDDMVITDTGAESLTAFRRGFTPL